MQKEIIPPEIKGKNINLENSVTLETKEEAEYTFKRACTRLLNPAVWHKLAGPASAVFILTGDKGEEENRLAKEGDHFKIDIPGPGPATGNGYDWVRVELIEADTNPGEDEDSCGIKLRASIHPGTKGNETAHFFKEEATSSFVIRRKANTVTASYYGRNEMPNVATGKATDNIRNTMVALASIAGLSELQWAALLKGFLEKEIGG